MTDQTLTTCLEGTHYVVRLSHMGAKPIVKVTMLRKKADGTTVEAFLSVRQRVAEATVRRRFAREIAEHLHTVEA